MQKRGGWYHAMSRGIDYQRIFEDDRDREHFLELLETAVGRYRVRLHAYVLMDNHFHLLLETPEGNLGACMQWLKQSYSMWHNVRHDRVGPLFQGRYRSIPVEDASWIFVLSIYMHLNPLRIARFKLSKVERQSEEAGLAEPLDKKHATARLRELRAFRWSSYRAYGGYVPAPKWLTVSSLLERAGGRDPRRSYRKEVMARLTGAEEGDVLEIIRDTVAVGSARFRDVVSKSLNEAGREIAGRWVKERFIPLDLVVKAVEAETRESVRLERRGGLGRDIALKVGRDLSGLSLRELGQRAGGLDYVSVCMAIQRLEHKMEKHAHIAMLIERIKRRL
jgi:REP element-mobilizing transposase RayT